jgi:PAS domain S-box-containing protein
MAMAGQFAPRRLDRLIYVPALAAIVGMWGVVTVFSLGERREALDRTQINLNFAVATLADANVAAVQDSSSDAQLAIVRDDALRRGLIQFPNAHIWIEESGHVTAGLALEGFEGRQLTATETRLVPGAPHGSFSVHAALPISSALVRWNTSVCLRAIALIVMTGAFLFLTRLLARAIRERAVAEGEMAKAIKRLILRDRALEAITQGITITDENQPGAPIIYTNPAFATLTRYESHEVLGRGSLDFFSPEKAAEFTDRVRISRAMNLPCLFETEFLRKDGTTFIDRTAISLIANDDGTVTHSVTVHEDVTDLRRREDMLLEAQKLESVGQLTGGIAHDFNNLLTAIRSNAEDLKEDLKDKPLSMRQADIVLQAAHRGAGLVAQLMAFARKQELKPQNVNVPELVRSFSKLVRSTLPANVRIDLREEQNLPAIHVDPGRLESALLNLCINSRDAMPEGGTITIETMMRDLDIDYVRENRDVIPGSYVMIAVTDTGSGMSKEIMKKAFTPFFTTKEVGRGTGLGLSMVYGFVKQSGGHARIYSEEGYGTVIKIYLPAVEAVAEAEPIVQRRTHHGSGSILIVEDDELVRQSISNKLSGFGYEVLTAATAHDAIDILNATPHFDLVFSDVIVPGPMTGADLVREVRNRWPKINVLLTSGYTESTVLGKVNIPPDVRLLSKPYSNAELADTVRAAMAPVS